MTPERKEGRPVLAVQGTIDDATYDVVITGRADEPVQGSRRVRALVQSAVRARRPVLLGPTGPRVPVRGDDPQTVLALLGAATQVHAVTGQEPIAGEAVIR